ncbi:hypothetical protein G0U57_013054 [Chelydra serpentina]|uniref:Uncharacterized protein n=1 Tax=Chelydra serpentina TaxID=8475 RepID=A0A8T1SAT6_CHESE|nr:hypothetical protein G0U57_013054 [Chelydra serpentina]
MGMIGDWFFLATACMLFLMAFNKDVLEVLQNAAFILLTISTIRQIPIRGANVFFGVSCSLYTAISLYATFASLINSISEKVLIPVGAQVMSSSTLQSVLMSVKNYLMRSKNIPGATICEVPDALFYICNGLSALSAIQGTLNDPIRQHLSIPSVLIPGAIFQLYVCRIQVQRGRRFGSVLPFCYAAIWATWTWLRFAGNTISYFSFAYSDHANAFKKQPAKWNVIFMSSLH